MENLDLIDLKSQLTGFCWKCYQTCVDCYSNSTIYFSNNYQNFTENLKDMLGATDFNQILINLAKFLQNLATASRQKIQFSVDKIIMVCSSASSEFQTNFVKNLENFSSVSKVKVQVIMEKIFSWQAVLLNEIEEIKNSEEKIEQLKQVILAVLLGILRSIR